MDENDLNNMLESLGSYGSLRPVSKCVKPFVCDICEKTYEKGTKKYTQSDYTNTSLYPSKRNVCDCCGEELIKNGTKVKEKKNVKSN